MTKWAAVGRGLRGFGAFWWDFIVGDDWRVAAGVVVALAVTALIAGQRSWAWVVMPIAVLAILTASVVAAARTARRR